MTFIDRIFVAVPLFLVVVVGIYAQLHVKSVVDFMSANRSAEQYLLSPTG